MSYYEIEISYISIIACLNLLVSIYNLFADAREMKINLAQWIIYYHFMLLNRNRNFSVQLT